MSEVKIGAWNVDESPVSVEYSLVVIEEVRREVTEGFQKFSRGGIEVGGVFYGARDGRMVRVLAIRPIACEHARGPGFMLSDNDRIALASQLERAHEDPQLEGMVCVGWYLSHTRNEINLTDSDLEIYNEFFSAPWQVAMVVRPGRSGAMRAGFFVREPDGSVKVDASYQEFNFPDRLSAVLGSDRPARADRRLGERRYQPISEVPVAVAPRPEQSFPPLEYESPRFLPAAAPHRKWPWFIAWVVVVVALLGLGARFYLQQTTQQPISLTLVERDGQLQVEWNQAARSITNAVRGNLSIIDGKETKQVALAPGELASGHYSYQRKSGDIEVRLSVQEPGGATVQEASRYLGQAPVGADPVELLELQRRRDELEAQVKRLTTDNASQAERIQTLERTLRILETRMGGKQPEPAK